MKQRLEPVDLGQAKDGSTSPPQQRWPRGKTLGKEKRAPNLPCRRACLSRLAARYSSSSRARTSSSSICWPRRRSTCSRNWDTSSDIAGYRCLDMAQLGRMFWWCNGQGRQVVMPRPTRQRAQVEFFERSVTAIQQLLASRSYSIH
jgi:hypothetical protein